MSQIFNKLLTMFWVFDICDLPFMEMFDTTYPINFGVYAILFLIWIVIPVAGGLSNREATK